MAAEPGNRYQHLLQPIRDLSKVWNIEIADELEKYIAEVAGLSFHGSTSARKLNFAEAALLIQGSTAIYSRKVEQLYALVYQALGQICAEKERGTDPQGRRKVPNGLWALVPETDELLTIGHLVKEGRNVTVDESSLQRQEQRQALHRRVPLFLMQRDRSDSKQEFRISHCTLHGSGAYLIQESDARLLEELLAREGHVQCSPLAPPPPGEVRALDEQLQELLRGLPATGEASTLAQPSPEPPSADAAIEFFDTEAPGSPGCGMAPEAPDCDGSPLQSLLRGPQRADADVISADPWALLDEDTQMGHDTLLEASSCSRRWGTKGLLAKGEGLPTAGTRELSDAELWRPGHAAEGLPAFMAAGHPVESLFLVVGTHLRNGGRTETERAGFSAAWLEFEDLFQAASTRRKKLQSDFCSVKKAKLGEAGDGPAPHTPHMAGHGGADSDDECYHAFTPPRGFPTEATQITPLKSELADGLDVQRQQVAKLEGLIEDAQSQYESSVRGKLQVMQGSTDVNGHKYPQLYENVRRWQEQLQPVLKEFESHPEFDINGYGAKLLGKMVAVEKNGEEEQQDQVIPFSRLVYGQPHWEVCRRFLTCLILTNQGNTDIVVDEEDDHAPLNRFGLKLLKAEAPHLSLYSDDEHEVMPIASCGDLARGKAQRESLADSVPTPMRRRGVKRLREGEVV